MASYQAEVQTTSTGGYMTVTVEAGSYGTAREVIDHIYNPISVRNLRQTRTSSSHDDGDGVDLQTVGIVLAVIFGFYIIATFWWVFGIIGAIVAGRWMWKKLTK